MSAPTLDLRHRRADVVVGYDGTWRSRGAVDRAAAEAVARRQSLVLLDVVARDEAGATSTAATGTRQQRWDRAVTDSAAEAERVARDHPGLRSSSVVVLDDALDSALPVLARCGLLMLGERGPLGVRAFLMGSTSRELVRSTACPVLVVPDDAPAVGPGSVVVGIGDDDHAVTLLQVAGDEALRRGRHLTVLHSYSRSGTSHSAQRADGPGSSAVDAAHLRVETLLRRADLDPRLTVLVELTPDAPVAALLRHAAEAGVLVLGTRGPIALARLALGSVSRAVLDATTVPLLLVPAGRRR